MNCFFTLSPSHVPYLANEVFYQIANELKKRGWYIGYVDKKNTHLKDHEAALCKSKNVICSTNYMVFLPKEFETIHSLIKKHDVANKILLICDVRPGVMETARSLKFDHYISFTGYLLPEYASNPNVFIPNVGFASPKVKSMETKQKVFVPMHHHSPPAKTCSSYIKTFYASRIALCSRLLHHSDVIFQKKLLFGKAYENAISRAVACVTSVPSNDYPFIIGKLFQIMSIGTLLIADTRPVTHIFNSLGFFHNVHYLETTPETVVSTVNYALDSKHSKHVLSMIQAAQDLIHQRHLPIHRVEQMSNFIEA